MLANLQLQASSNDDGRGGGPAWSEGPSIAELEELPYRIEVWDETASFAETLVAITVSPALAYAAYYAAAREFSGRDVTITHRGLMISHWRARRS